MRLGRSTRVLQGELSLDTPTMYDSLDRSRCKLAYISYHTYVVSQQAGVELPAVVLWAQYSKG